MGDDEDVTVEMIEDLVSQGMSPEEAECITPGEEEGLPKNYLETTISEDNPHRKPKRFGEGSVARGPDEELK